MRSRAFGIRKLFAGNIRGNMGWAAGGFLYCRWLYHLLQRRFDLILTLRYLSFRLI